MQPDVSPISQPEKASFSRISWAVLAAGVFMLSLAGAFFWLHLSSPSDGARFEPGQSVWKPNGVVVTPLEAQVDGLQEGDVVIAVEGISMESWARALFQPYMPRPKWQFGETVTYSILRQGNRLDVPVALRQYPLGAVLKKTWGTIIFELVSQLVAAYVFLRRPNDRAARVLFLWASGVLSSSTWSIGLQMSDLISGAGFWLYVAGSFGSYMIFWIAGLHFALIFPRELPVILDHPWIIRYLYIAPYAFYPFYLAAVLPASSSTLDWLGQWSRGNSILVLVYLVLTVIVIFWGYRTNRDASSRQKIRWVAFAALVSGGGGLALWILPPLVVGRNIISANVLGVLILPFPLALAVAILRHRLFDIDFVINRMLVYGALTAGTMGIYVLIVGYLGELFQARDRSLIAFLTTGLVAVFFQPLRERLQRSVNRLMYGERDDPYAVLARLGRRLEALVAPEAVLPTIVETVAQALRLPYVAVTLKEGETFRVAASFGLPVSSPLIFPLTYQTEIVGQLHCAPRTPGEDFTEADQRLLRNIARQAEVAAHAVRLTADLRRSRQRLVTAREEERRRLRRDLHDGLGPVLASQGLKMAAASQLIDTDPVRAKQMLEELASQNEVTVTEIRRLVYALRPAALDELGLVGAVRDYAAGVGGIADQASLKVIVHEPKSGLPPIPAAIEVAAYRIACEAITNVARHAQAQRCLISFKLQDNGAEPILQLEITDDGIGIPDNRKVGVGLTSMRERADEVGGEFHLESAPKKGARVIVRLPLAE